MSAEYNNLYMVVSVSLPYHTLATVIFFVVLCGGVVWHGVMYTRMCVCLCGLSIFVFTYSLNENCEVPHLDGFEFALYFNLYLTRCTK